MISNETCYCNKLGQYLLQIRTIDNNKNIQECCSLYRNRKQDYNFYAWFDFSFVWNYANDKTYFLLTWTPNISKDTIHKLFNLYTDLEFLSNETRQAKFSQHGFNLKIM